MKKIMKFLVVLGLLSTTVLSGCSEKGNTNNTTKETNDVKATSNINPPGTFPIVKEKVTLKVMAGQRPFVEDYTTNWFTKWFEEKTNVHIEWETAPEGDQATQKLNLTLASGTYPDVFMNLPITNEMIELYGGQGVFLPIDEYYEENTVELKKIFEKNPAAKEIITSNDGHIYSFPEVNECFHCTYQAKLWIYQPWLDKLGLEMPTTTDEFYNVLKAFKTQDPNGNGKADEIPLAGSPSGWNTDITQFIMNSFAYYDTVNGETSKYLFMNNGQVDAVFNKPEYKEGLAYLSKLYNEGLIAPTSFTMDNNQLTQLGENKNDVILGSAGGGGPFFVSIDSETKRWKDYVTVPPLKGPGGDAFVDTVNNPGVSPGKLVINANSELKEVAMRWADAFYNEEVMYNQLFGEPNVDWKKADASLKGVNGEQAAYEVISPVSIMQNKGWDQAAPSFRDAAFRLSEGVKNPEDSLEVKLYNETLKYQDFRKDDVIVPPLVLSDEQSSEILDMRKSIMDYVKEMQVRFITGDQSVDKDWDSYIAELDNMNLKRYLEILNEAYNIRYKK